MTFQIGFRLFTVLALVFVMGCSTIRMNYQADVKTPEGKKSTYSLVKSYDIGDPNATLCWLTGIFFGGYCWYYLVMPTVNQSKMIEADAHARLDKALGSGKYDILSSDVRRQGWNDAPEDSKLVYYSKDSVPVPKTETK